MFTKYPRTKHLPWSPGKTKDDRILTSTEHFVDKHVVVTVKMDGENTTLYSNGLHARSLSSCNHPSRSWIKRHHASLSHLIPEGFRVCGENLYAKHSIYYQNLQSYFLVFSIWDHNNICLSWEDTIEYCNLLNLKAVPAIWRGIYNEEKIKSCFAGSFDGDVQEGYVVRISGSFCYKDFDKSLAKYVRENHVQTDEHWMNSAIVPNKLRQHKFATGE